MTGEASGFNTRSVQDVIYILTQEIEDNNLPKLDARDRPTSFSLLSSALHSRSDRPSAHSLLVQSQAFSALLLMS